jgi:hypothetical protein
MSLLYTYKQPYVSWKGNTVNANVPRWSRPIINGDIRDSTISGYQENGGHANYLSNGVWNTTRPIKHWRKQLIPNQVNGTSRSSYRIQDMPGSSNVTENCISNQLQIGVNDDTCTLVNGICKQNVKPTKGMNTKLINPTDNHTSPTQSYSFDTKAYLRSKNKSYAQNTNGNVYDSQRTMTSCSLKDSTCKNITVKPNNAPYFQQGAVSSSSRILRLKYNTVTSNAVSFNTAFGASASSAGKYRADGNSSYFIKNKTNICNASSYQRNGNKLSCSKS